METVPSVEKSRRTIMSARLSIKVKWCLRLRQKLPCDKNRTRLRTWRIVVRWRCQTRVDWQPHCT